MNRYVFILICLGILFGVMSTQFAGASAGTFESSSINTGDTAWMLLATALVMLMTPCVGLFYGGMVRSINVVSVLKQSLVILALVSLQWMLVGYTLVFGHDIHGLIGDLTYMGLRGVGFAPNMTYAPTIPHLLFMMYQGMFAVITPALIIGAVVERMRFRTLLLFTLCWTTFVYDPLAHWVWAQGGWLHTMGALDFAGGTVVHISAGFSAVAAAWLVGKRKGKNLHNGTANNVPFILLGTAFLWFGWFGFNGGSALAASPLAVNAFVVTNMAAAAAAVTWMVLSWAVSKKPSAIAMATGAVCGLVAVTPASGFIGPMASVSLGILSGIITFFCLQLRTKHINVDDSLDVWAAHGMGGVSGALLTGVFAEKVINPAGANGWLFGNAAQFGIQALSVVVTAAFAFVMSYGILRLVSMKFHLRVPGYEEEQGLDLAVHGEPGYLFHHTK